MTGVQTCALPIYSLAIMRWDQGQFEDALALRQALVESIKRRTGAEPGLIIEAELGLLSAHAALGRVQSAAAQPSLRATLERITAKLPLGSRNRTLPLAKTAEVSAAVGLLDIAKTAVKFARASALAAGVDEPEISASVDQADASVAAAGGDFPRGVTLLGARAQAIAMFGEGDTIRHAALWLQRAIFEVEFDRNAATLSLAQSRATVERAGGSPPQFKALFTYVTARISGNAHAVRAAQAAVDRAYLRGEMRGNNATWRAPNVLSL